MSMLKDFIKSRRKKLSEQSLNTYASILKNLHINVFGSPEIDIDNFARKDDILKYLKSIPPHKRKTVLSALVIVTDISDYRDQMLKDIDTYNKEQHMQEMSEKQVDSWVDTEDIMLIYNKLSRAVKLIYKKEDIDSKDLQIIQNHLILSLLGGIYIPPRRSKDYVEFKIHNVGPNDNYMINGKNGNSMFVFNNYKTAKTYGQQRVEIPKELKAIMTKWIKINPTDYLLFDTNNNKLSNVKLNQRLNKLFDYKKVGVNQLRHTYLSDKYQSSIETNNKMANDLKNMGSSMIQEKIYIKKTLSKIPPKGKMPPKQQEQSDVLDV